MPVQYCTFRLYIQTVHTDCIATLKTFVLHMMVRTDGDDGNRGLIFGKKYQFSKIDYNLIVNFLSSRAVMMPFQGDAHAHACAHMSHSMASRDLSTHHTV